MTNNDILRRLRYCFDLNDKKMVALFALADYTIHQDQVIDWLRKDDDPRFERCGDHQLEHFLDGLIIDRRGPKDGPKPSLAKTLSRNLILRKLRIAINARDEDMLEIFRLAEFAVSKPELSALFRRPDHPHYRACKDQMLRNFLTGLQLKLRSRTDTPAQQKKPAPKKTRPEKSVKPNQKSATRKPTSGSNKPKVNSDIWG